MTNPKPYEGHTPLANAVLNVLPVGNDKHPDSKVVAFYLTAGELRSLRELATDAARVNKGPAADAMAEALEALGKANEELCAARSPQTYSNMIHQDDCHNLLIALDEARRAARQALAAYREKSE